MKCLPRDKIPFARGNILHDWHAEILAIRGFNRWILDECEALTLGNESLWLQWRTGWQEAEERSDEDNAARPFQLKPGVDIHMYVSSAPCGDASMELTMAAQKDATPWTSPAPSAAPDDMPGRAHFDQLGIVRRKPSRPDAPSTWSKSCSDKLAMKQCTGLLSSMTSKLVDPSTVYLTSLILPEGEMVPSGVQRAFEDRMKSVLQDHVQQQWAMSGHSFKPFTVSTTTQDFAFHKTAGATSSNVAALWTPHRSEALVNGVLMGRKQFDARGASCVSRRCMWQAVSKIALAAGMLACQTTSTYSKYKQDTARDRVKDDVKRLSLQGWRRNDGDEDWTLE